MTGARRSETLSLTWDNIDLVNGTAFIPETKNGRPRTIPLRDRVIDFLKQLPRDGETVFPISLDSLRKAWGRICLAAGLVENDDLLVHDLRHEAISRVAHAGGRNNGTFTLLDLQAFSGHCDMRMRLAWNRCPVCAGITVQFAAEQVSSLRGIRTTTGKPHHRPFWATCFSPVSQS